MIHVTKELAHKLRDIGFDVPTTDYWYDGDTGNNVDRFMQEQSAFNHNDEDMCVSAPDLHCVTDWLREKHRLHVLVCTNTDHDGWIAGIQSKGTFEPIGVINDDEPVATFSEALTSAIERAVDIVKTKMENEAIGTMDRPDGQG